ncbi:hypothetical protein CsSME_00006128 [Camellia sinensis var. sinensis]
MICVPLWVIRSLLGHRNAFTAVPLWVIRNVSVHTSHRNALWLSLYGSPKCLHSCPVSVIRFVNANGYVTYYDVKCIKSESEYDQVYESVIRRETRSRVDGLRFRFVSHPLCLPRRFQIMSNPVAMFLWLLANYDAKPIRAGLGRDRVVSEHQMENTISDETTESFEARMSRMEQMLAALTEAMTQQQQRQQPLPPPHSPPPVETWLLEMEKLFKVFSCSETQKGGLDLDILDRVGVLNLPTYVNVLDRALLAEAIFPANKQTLVPTSEWRGKRSGSILTCSECGRKHKGVCYRASGACFRCGKTDHMMRDCPVRLENTNHPATSSVRSALASRMNTKANTGKETLKQGRVFSLVPSDIQNTESVVSVIISIYYALTTVS